MSKLLVAIIFFGSTLPAHAFYVSYCQRAACNGAICSDSENGAPGTGVDITDSTDGIVDNVDQTIRGVHDLTETARQDLTNWLAILNGCRDDIRDAFDEDDDD